MEHARDGRGVRASDRVLGGSEIGLARSRAHVEVDPRDRAELGRRLPLDEQRQGAGRVEGDHVAHRRLPVVDHAVAVEVDRDPQGRPVGDREPAVREGLRDLLLTVDGDGRQGPATREQGARGRSHLHEVARLAERGVVDLLVANEVAGPPIVEIAVRVRAARHEQPTRSEERRQPRKGQRLLGVQPPVIQPIPGEGAVVQLLLDQVDEPLESAAHGGLHVEVKDPGPEAGLRVVDGNARLRHEDRVGVVALVADVVPLRGAYVLDPVDDRNRKRAEPGGRQGILGIGHRRGVPGGHVLPEPRVLVPELQPEERRRRPHLLPEVVGPGDVVRAEVGQEVVAPLEVAERVGGEEATVALELGPELDEAPARPAVVDPCCWARRTRGRRRSGAGRRRGGARSRR